MSKRKPEQQTLFQLHHTFFVFLNALALDGTLARIQTKCSASLAVLVCLKTSADFSTGLCSKGTKLLAQQAGCSRVSVHNAVKALEEEGLVEVVQRENGKRSIYRVFDKVMVRKDGQEAGTIRFPFSPMEMKDRLEDLQTFRHVGELPARAHAAGVKVNFVLNLNITQIENAQNVFVGATEFQENLEALQKVSAGPWKKAALRALRDQFSQIERSLELQEAVEQQREFMETRAAAEKKANSHIDMDIDLLDARVALDNFVPSKKDPGVL